MNTIIVLVFGILVLVGPSCTNSDNLAPMTDAFKTMQRAACDNEMVSLSCPTGTSIYIQVAQYGKILPGGHACAGKITKGEVVDEEQCLWPNIMQYSILQTVVEACQKKPQCTFSTKSKVDPCPRARKFVEVAYKCRPQEYRSRTGCEDEVIKLSCNANSRVVILNATYGRSAHESVSCPQPQSVVDETCLNPYALRIVMQICHARRSCQIVANKKTFGPTCSQLSRNYFEVVYACVPVEVLKKPDESTDDKEPGGGYSASRDGELFDVTDIGEKWRGPASQPSIDDDNLRSSDKDGDSTHVSINGIVKDEEDSSLIKGSSNYSSNTKFIIYIGIGVLLIIVLFAIVFGIKCYKKRQRANSSKNGDMFTTEAPNIFSDTASDIDNDVDVSRISGTFYDPLHPDMIIYRDGQTKTALRAMKPLSTVYPTAGACMYGNVDYVPSHSRDIGFTSKERDPGLMMSPKSLAAYNNSQFLYG